MTLAPEARAAWEADGFLVLPGFVDGDRCDGLRAHALELLDRVDPTVDGALTVFSTIEQTHAQDQWFLTSGDKIRWFLEEGAVVDGELTRPLVTGVNKLGHALHDLDPVFDRFSRTAELAELAADVGFDDPVLLQSMYIFKQPQIGGEVAPHCDHSFLWTEPCSVVGFWFAIEDATVDNGCLWVIPGGHGIPARIRFRREGSGTVTEVLDADPYPQHRLVPLEVEKGTLVVLHGRLPHGSSANTSERSRHAYTLHVIDRSAEYLSDNWLQRPALPLRGFA